jgi:hypothetical protein
MKFFFLTMVILPLIIWRQCSDEPDDCLCTEEFRMYLVTIVDTLGNPVDSVHTSITNELGKDYDFSVYSPPPLTHGAYIVMTDGYEKDFLTGPKKIFFFGRKDNKETSAEFLFRTDKCLCHVYKSSGPDTLIIK